MPVALSHKPMQPFVEPVAKHDSSGAYEIHSIDGIILEEAPALERMGIIGIKAEELSWDIYSF